jgi:FkbM family methyltransferase
MVFETADLSHLRANLAKEPSDHDDRRRPIGLAVADLSSERLDHQLPIKVGALERFGISYATVLKKSAQTFLTRVGLYERLKSSFVYDFYWAFANQQILEERAKEIEFYKNTLQGFRKGYLIFDIGANQGYKTDIFLRLGARVVAVDPDKENQESLRQRFLKYRLRPKRVDVEGKAVSDAIATKTMWIDAPGSAKNTLSPKWVATLRTDQKRFGQCFEFASKEQVETVTLEKLIATHGIPFFIKIDVEGHEPSVLRGLNRPVPYLSFEVNLPEFRLESLQCVDILRGIASDGQFNYAVDCERGLMLENWMRCREFARVMEGCEAPSIEVFWRTSFCAN